MGALATNRKRGEHIFNLNGFSSPCRADLHVSKKPRFSSKHLTPDSSISSISPISDTISTKSRLQQYPKPTQSIKREVHGPCRNPKFQFHRGGLDEMGNLIFQRLSQAKNVALGTFRYFSPFRYLTKGKEVMVDVDEPRVDEEEEVVLDDSSDDEVVEILDIGKREREEDKNHRNQVSSSVVIDLSNHTPIAVDDAEDVELKEKYRKFEESDRFQVSSSVHEVVDLSEDVPLYKKHLDTAEKRNAKIEDLEFQIGLIAEKLSLYSKLGKKKPEEEDVSQKPFIPLTEEEEDKVTSAFSKSNRRKVLVTHADSNLEITGEMLQCLRPGAWLNDEVINLYLELLKEREIKDPTKFLKCHFFNTFFYKKLISGKEGYDYNAVRRWTTKRKIGYCLIECDKIFVPIHKEIHWCLAVINKKDQKFQYLDSLKGKDLKVLNALAKYYVDEAKDKSAKDIDVSSWKHECVSDLPEQENGFDCGMFMIKYADFYSRGLGLIFNQEHMSYFRRRIVKEILRLKAE